MLKKIDFKQFRFGMMANHDYSRPDRILIPNVELEIDIPVEYTIEKTKLVDEINKLQFKQNEINLKIDEYLTDIKNQLNDANPNNYKEVKKNTDKINKLIEELNFESVVYDNEIKKANDKLELYKEKYVKIYEENRNKAVIKSMNLIQSKKNEFDKLSSQLYDIISDIATEDHKLKKQYSMENRDNARLRDKLTYSYYLEFNDIIEKLNTFSSTLEIAKEKQIKFLLKKNGDNNVKQ